MEFLLKNRLNLSRFKRSLLQQLADHGLGIVTPLGLQDKVEDETTGLIKMNGITHINMLTCIESEIKKK